MVWYSDFGHQFIGEMDPKTGKVTEIPKSRRCKPEQPKGSLDLEFDPQGNIWLSMMYQAGILKFDRKTKQVTAYPVPEGMAVARPRRPRWCRRSIPTSTARSGPTTRIPTCIYRVDVATGKYEDIGQCQGHDRHAHQRLRHADRPAEQRLSAELRRHDHRPARRQDQRGHDLEDADCRHRGRGAAGSTPTTCCGSPNTAPTASASSIRRPA